MSVTDDLARFHALIARLQHRQGGPAPLGELDLGRLPRAGVYFFFDGGNGSPAPPSRLVRVGTHGLAAGSRSTLGQRLAQHRGSRDGSGNHRGSIFRLLVGDALLRRGDWLPVPSWGVGSDIGTAARRLGRDRGALKAEEQPLEQAVSAIIGAMHVVVLGIDDPAGSDSLRGLIERNAIGLLSSPDARALQPAPPDWLGHFSSREAVRGSGLWNNRHVGERHAPVFLDRLERLVP